MLKRPTLQVLTGLNATQRNPHVGIFAIVGLTRRSQQKFFALYPTFTFRPSNVNKTSEAPRP